MTLKQLLCCAMIVTKAQASFDGWIDVVPNAAANENMFCNVGFQFVGKLLFKQSNPSLTVNVVEQRKCVECENGKFRYDITAPIFRESQNRLACSDCPEGRFSNNLASKSARDCFECPTGKFASTKKSAMCSMCPADMYQEAPKLWNLGFGTPASALDWTVDKWTYTRCGFCPAGKFLEPGSSQHQCKFCPEGKFNVYKTSNERHAGLFSPSELCDGSFVMPLYREACHDSSNEDVRYRTITGCQSCPKGQFSDSLGFERIGAAKITQLTQKKEGYVPGPRFYYTDFREKCFDSRGTQPVCKMCRKTYALLANNKPNFVSDGAQTCEKCHQGNWIPGFFSGINCCKCDASFLGANFPVRRNQLQCSGSDCLNFYYPKRAKGGACTCVKCEAGREPFFDRRNEKEDSSVRCASCRLDKFRSLSATETGKCQQCPQNKIPSLDLTSCVECPVNQVPYDRKHLALNTPLTEMKNDRISLNRIFNAMKSSLSAFQGMSEQTMYNDLVSNDNFFQDIQMLVIPAEIRVDAVHEHDNQTFPSFYCKRNWYMIDPRIFKGQSIDSCKYPTTVPLCCSRPWKKGLCGTLSVANYNNQQHVRNSVVSMPTSSQLGFRYEKMQHLHDLLGHLYWKCIIEKQKPCGVYADFIDSENNTPLEMLKNTVCKFCPAGKVRKQGESKCETIRCDPGKEPLNTADSFTLLPQNLITCKACPTDQYNDVFQSSAKCKQCAIGESTWGLTGQAFCTKRCVAGYFGAGLNGKNQNCSPCPRGKFSSNTDPNTLRNNCDVITNCKTGGYLPTFPPATSNSTVPCPAGKFKPVSAICNDECTACEPGKFQDNQGQTACKKCPKGKYQDFRGRNACKNIQCKPGTFINPAFENTTELNSTKGYCRECPAGKHTFLRPGQTECVSSGPNFDFSSYDVVRQRLFSCYGSIHNWAEQNIGTLVLCPCQGVGDTLTDDFFVKELAQKFSIPLAEINSALTKFYKFSSKYDASPQSKHNIRFKHVDGFFNAKPFVQSLTQNVKKQTYHNISVLNHNNAQSVLQGSIDVCWSMLLRYLELQAPRIILAKTNAISVPMLNAFSDNLCTKKTCPKAVKTFSQTEIEELATKKSVLFYSQMEIVDSICRLQKHECYNHCEKYINPEYNKCAFVAAQKHLTAEQKKIENSQDPFEGRFCKPDRKEVSLCLVFKQNRQTQATPVNIHRLWSLDNFNCMEHTTQGRRFLRRKCFESNNCNSYATNKTSVCMLDATGQSTKNAQFTNVYRKTEYNEEKQRLRLENVNTTNSYQVSDSSACKRDCYNNIKCYAWQHNVAVNTCTLLTTESNNFIDPLQSQTQINQKCGQSILQSSAVTNTCENINNRLKHAEVFKFWREQCCKNSSSKIFAEVGCNTCDSSPQVGKSYCGLNVVKLQPNTKTNTFYAQEGDKSAKLTDENMQYRIGNFRDGFSGFKAGCSENEQDCVCNFQFFNKQPSSSPLPPSKVTAPLFCQRRSFQQETNLNCGTITSRRAVIEFKRAPSCEVCPITHVCSEQTNTCVIRNSIN